MNWYSGEVGAAIQKAIGEKKVFVVFVKDDSENSSKMEELWNDTDVAEACTDDKCVAISITADSVPGQQFGAIYPVLVVPSTYLINNTGIPADIIPGLVEKDEFVKRLSDAVEKTLTEAAAMAPVSGGDPAPVGVQDPVPVTVEDPAPVSVVEPAVVSEDAGAVESEGASVESLNDDLDAELTPQEVNQIEMLREKVKLKREQEEKEKAKEEERRRREQGAELLLAQRAQAERQALKLAKEIADRKSEDKAAREKVKEQIRRDQLEKKARFEQEKKERSEASKKKSEAAAAATAAEVEKKKAALSNTARILFRLPDGSSVSNTFNSDATFFLAETFIKEHLGWSRVRLTTVYPKHEFTSEDMLKSFRDLGLAPNASIIVSAARSEASGSSVSTSSPASFLWLVFSPLFGILNWIASFFSSGGTNTSTSASPEPAQSSSGASNNEESSVRRRNPPKDSRSNIQRLRRDDDDENATWNGNSTQQM